MQNNSYPKISIVTPSYNQGEFLEQTILSVLNQKYPNLEYVVIDGGSTDSSVDIIKKYSKQLTYWHSKPDNGQSDAINTGFSKTTGEIMFWINSDDVLMPGSLHLVASIFKKNKQIKWLSALPTTITVDGFINYSANPPFYFRPFIERGFYIRSFCGFIMQEGTFWRRSLWKKTGGYVKEVPYSMDWDLWRRFAAHSELVLVKAVLAGYRLNPNRKNNDEHEKYYNEIGMNYPSFLTLPFKYLWKKIAVAAHLLHVPSLVFYDEGSAKWKYRDLVGKVHSFKVLS